MSTVVLIGKGPSALTALESLAEKFDVAGVIRHARPGPRGEDEVQCRARELGVPLFTDTSLSGVQQVVTSCHPDCTIISSYDRILGAGILDRCGFVNVHYSLLPRYRGIGPVQWGVFNGEPELGITIHAITKELDAGNVLYQSTVAVGPHETVNDVYSKLNAIQRRVLAGTVERYLGGYAGVPQDEPSATYTCARVPEDSEVDWSESTQRIYAQVRAFHEALSIPYPPAYTYLDTRRLSILRAAPVPDAPRYAGRVPGRVVSRPSARGYVDVLTGDGVLRIHEVRADDGVARPAAAVISSTQQTLGLRVAELLSRVDALSRQLDQLLASPKEVGYQWMHSNGS